MSQDLPESITRGDVRLVTAPHADQRLCLILNVTAEGLADVVLIHAEPELATSADGVVPPSVSGVAYPLVVQTDLRCTVWSSQVGRRVGHLGGDVLDTLNGIAAAVYRECSPFAYEPTGTVPEVWSGRPLGGTDDARWHYKVSEGDALRKLASGLGRHILASLVSVSSKAT